MATTYYSTEVRPNAGAQIIMYLLRVLEIILALRFFLRLFAANPTATFTNFIYNISQPFVAPFANVFRSSAINNPPGSVFEWTTLLAMIVYWILAVVLVRLFAFSQPRVVRHAYAKEEDDIDDDEVV